VIFDLKKSEIYKAVRFHRLFPAGILKFWRVLLFTLGLVPLALFIINKGYETGGNISLGWLFIVLPFAFSVVFFELYGKYYLQQPTIMSTDNIADLLEFEAARIFDQAFELSRSWGDKTLSIKTLLAAMIEDQVIEKLFIRIIPQFKTIRKQFRDTLVMSNPFAQKFSLFVSQEISPAIMKLLEDSLVLRDKHGSQRISVLDILAVMYDHNEEFKQFILAQDLDRDDLEELARWYEHIWSFWRNYRRFWALENLLRQPPVGRDWTYGYSRHLTAFASNLSDKMEFARPSVKLVSRKKEIEHIEQILARSGENNVLLVGEEGVGKENIILDFAEMIVKGRAHPQLNYKKVFDLNLSLVAGASKEISDVQNILLNIFNEASKAGNVILVLRDFHNFIGEIGGLGRRDVSEILTPYLRSSKLQVIATTNPPSFHKFIEGRSELMDAFERIDITEPDLIQTLRIIEEEVPAIE